MIRVVKVGGRAQQDPALIPALAAAWRATSGALVVVHGGGDDVTAVQRTMGREPRFIDGRRVTTDDDIAILRMTLSGVINKRLVASLVAAGVPAVGVSGEDAALLSAEPIDEAVMGRAGEPAETNVALVKHLLRGGYLPVISPLARDARSPSGDALNVNGDDAAAAIASALHATDLLLVADVAGVLEQGKVIPVLDAQRSRALVTTGTVTAGMIAKLDAAEHALAGGVSSVRIGDLSAIADLTLGTRIVTAASAHALTTALA
ncbi:MAG TPA: acetylglutamate kinase [Gemmatimonadaceae bacterium]|nr:acetylglutamate kinase [Gemmatimonadaceae bacterium]